MRPPTFEPRRRKQLQDELLARARTWLADWNPRDEGDFAIALFKIVARLESEVTQRLDRAPEKAFRAFLDWLGIQGRPGLPARLPVVLTMTPGSDPVDAPAGIQLQVNAAERPVNFETEGPLRILPGALTSLIAADPERDAFSLPPVGAFPLGAPALVPNTWTLKSDSPAQTTSLQLDPPVGLDPGTTIADPAGRPYRIVDSAGALVTITPPLDAPLTAQQDVMTRVTTFSPFDDQERNRQEHALYIGSAGALNVEAAATIAIRNGASISPDAAWSYAGKRTPSAPVDWIPIEQIAIDGADLVLTKPKGAIETMKIDGYSSRWLRATRPPGFSQSSETSGLRLLVNCLELDDVPPVTALEGIGNTTPLVLDAGFYPFGREPRQFDSFYIGSKEAFSKPSAEAVIHFSLGLTVRNARATVGISDTEYLTFGVGEDGRMQRTGHRISAGKPLVLFLAPTQPASADHKPISLSGAARPGAAILAGIPYVSAAAGTNVWVCKQTPLRDEWIDLGVPFTAADGSKPAVTATMLARSASQLAAYAVSDGQLHQRLVDGGAWAPIVSAPAMPAKPEPAGIVTVAPILKLASRGGEQDAVDGIVVVTDQKELWWHNGTDWKLAGGGPAEVDPDFYPLTVLTGAGDRVCLVRDGADQRPNVFDINTNGTGEWASLDLVGHAADFRSAAGEVQVVFVAVDGGQPPAVHTWKDFTNETPVADTQSGPALTEGPLYVGGAGGVTFFLVAGENGEAFILPLRLAQSVTGAFLTDAVTFTDPLTDWTLKDHGFPIDLDPSSPLTDVVFVNRVFRGSAPNSWVLELPAVTGSTLTNDAITLHPGKHDDLRTGIRKGPKKLQLVADDPEAVTPGLVYISDGTSHELFEIDTVTPATATTPRTLTFAAAGPNLPGIIGDLLLYKCVDPIGIPITGSVQPLVELMGINPAFASTLQGSTVEFPALSPSSQIVEDVLAVDGRAVLASPWTTTPPNAPASFEIQGNLFDPWVIFEPPKPRNPTLSWEYFDGTAWRLIEGLRDFTDNLARGDNVKFCVPGDLQPTDVVGHKNHWIRARLVGGDYGEATVTVTTSPGDTPNSTKQTVDRNLDSIRAPYIASMTVKYRVCCPVVPDVVLTRDNGALVDRTNVNRPASAVVDYFVPLSTALSAAAGGDTTSAPGARALYLGFDTKLTGGPITILFLLDEGTHDQAFPLRVDALAGSRFKPVLSRDSTRGLNESGVLEIDLAESPQLAELFGASRYWLRVRPGPRLTNESEWQPHIRAAYLNATWAIAADTQFLEPLGSSDGSPGQQFVLARPPVIENSLRLRVLERLGDEDIEKLQKEGVDIQKTLPDVPVRQGCWVLWKQVVDPADEPAGARVYALDDATGIITFGNGLHGMIPPIGSNVILAERYQRGGGAAANKVTAWSRINLVTSLPGVNAVVAPEGAAGGSDPQDPDETVRFAPGNLRVRDRALTLADFEMLALQFSRDIAQARALPTRKGVRLVIAMRGRDAAPPAAVIRELRAYLLRQSSPMLAADDVLQIVAPREVPTRIELVLVIDAIEASGAVGRDVRDRLAALLDPASGGHDRIGWPLGEPVTDTEVAAALVGIPHLEGIKDVAITTADGVPVGRLDPSQLVRLMPDGVVVTMRLEEEAKV